MEYRPHEYNITHNKYSCHKCSFQCDNKKDYDRHENTSKHKFTEKRPEFKCPLCEAGFNSRSTLWRHKKKCNPSNELEITKLKEEMDQLKNTNKLLEENRHLKDKIIELTKNSMVNVNHTTNATFNLNMFLNETCKDAMNISDFINEIIVSIEDLKYLGKKGYVEGISKLISTNLKRLDITKRPLHCSDVKRETIYIKENNTWEKENDQKERLNKVLRDIIKLNTRALMGSYKEKYPQCMTDYNSREHIEYGEIAFQAVGGKSRDMTMQNNKVIRKIVNHIEITKRLDY